MPRLTLMRSLSVMLPACVLVALASGAHAGGAARHRPPHTSPVMGQGAPAAWRTAFRSMYGAPYQRHVAAYSRGWTVSLQRWSKCERAASGECYFFLAEDAADHKLSRFRVANLTAQVDAVTVLSRGEVAVLGRATANLAVVSLVGLASGRQIDTFVCFWPVISPSLRYVAYVKWFPEHIGSGYSLTFEYLVYDLSASPTDNRPVGGRLEDVYDVGWPVYPLGARNAPGDTTLEGNNRPVHSLASDGFFWIGENAVAFADRWHNENSLVVADLGAGAGSPLLSVRTIESNRLVDFASCDGRVAPSDLERWRKSPATLIHATEISSLPAKQGCLQLKLAPNACLATTTVDVPTSSKGAQPPAGCP